MLWRIDRFPSGCIQAGLLAELVASYCSDRPGKCKVACWRPVRWREIHGIFHGIAVF